MTTIEIHEFSTGIEFHGTLNQWWFEDFAVEEFMNSTLKEIPLGVERAIEQELLSIYSFPVNSDPNKPTKPVIIGREIKRKKQTWSILAVVTLTQDSQQTDIFLCRYFLTEGLGRLSDLLVWYNQMGKPSFNPFDTKIVGQPYLYDDTKTPAPNNSPRIQNLLTTANHHKIVVPYDLSLPPIQLNQLAEQVKKKNDLVAWAYNIQEVYKPRKFQVIYPADYSSQIVLENNFAARSHLFKDNDLLTAIFSKIIRVNQFITDLINDIYYSIFQTIKIPFICVFFYLFLGGILVGPFFTFALFFRFSLGLGWLFFVIFIFLFGFDLGKRLR